MLLEAVALKLVPLMITVLPMEPDVGAKELIEGWA